MPKKKKGMEIPSFLEPKKTPVGAASGRPCSRANAANPTNRKKRKTNSKFKKKTNKINKLKLFLLILILVGLVVGLLMTPLFNVVEIKVEGNQKITTEQILSDASIEMGQNIFRINKIGIKNTISKNSYIKSVKIVRQVPSTIKIEIQERQPTLQVPFINGCVLLDSQGYILEIISEPGQAVAIEGLVTQFDEFVPGNRLKEEDLLKLEKVLKILETAKSNDLISKINAVDIKDELNYKLTIEEGNKKVNLGDASDLTTKLLYLKQILIKEEGKKGTVYLNESVNVKNPKFIEQV